jgi:hypothetical protein
MHIKRFKKKTKKEGEYALLKNTFSDIMGPKLSVIYRVISSLTL